MKKVSFFTVTILIFQLATCILCIQRHTQRQFSRVPKAHQRRRKGRRTLTAAVVFRSEAYGVQISHTWIPTNRSDTNPVNRGREEMENRKIEIFHAWTRCFPASIDPVRSMMAPGIRSSFSTHAYTIVFHTLCIGEQKEMECGPKFLSSIRDVIEQLSIKCFCIFHVARVSFYRHNVM